MKILVYIGSCIGIAGFIWMLFERTDKVITETKKKEVSDWLQNLSLEGNSKLWPSFFIETFDSIFGKKHLSKFRIKRSVQASMVSTIILTPLAVFVSYEQTIQIREENHFFIIVFMLVLLPILSLMFNALPDYFSILQTRFILKYMEKCKSHKSILFFAVLDFLLTSILIVSYMSLILWLISGQSDDLYIGFEKFASLAQFKPPEGMSPETGLYGTFIYSTFFLSIWSWLYCFSILAVKLIKSMDSRWIWLRDSFLDIKNSPIVSLGWISSMLLVFIFMIAAPFAI